MDYSDEQLKTVEDCASVYMTIKDIALIIEVDDTVLRADVANEQSEVSRRYRRGKAISKLELHKQEMALAKVGSPMALENAKNNLMELEDDE